MKKEEILNIILNKNTKEKRMLLKSNKIREELLKKDNIDKFDTLLNILDIEDLNYFLDDNLIALLIKYNNADHLYYLKQYTKCSHFLSNPKILKHLINTFDNYRDSFKNLDYDFSIKLVNYIINNPEYIENILNLNPKIQYQLLENKIIRNKLLNLNTNKDFMFLFNKEIITMLLNDPNYYNIFINGNIDDIHAFIKDNDYIPDRLICNKIINKYINIIDINKYRTYIEEITNIPLKYLITKKRKKYYKENINSIKDNLLPYYNNIYERVLNDEDYESLIKKDSYYFYREPFNERVKNKEDFNSLSNNTNYSYNKPYYYQNIKNNKNNIILFKKYLQELSTKKLFEMIIDNYFEDITYNFLSNLKTLLEYITKIDKIIIPKENLNIYKKIYNFYNLTTKEQINLFNELDNNINYKEMFYNDFITLKKHSYNSIKEGLININNLNKSNKYNNTYELNGEDFYLLVHHTNLIKETGGTFNKPSNTLSLSLISHNYMNTFKDPSHNIILGFDIDINNIIHLYESDSFSEELEGSRRLQRLYTKEDLINNTKSYNEILVLNKNNYNNSYLSPKYVICFDTILEGDKKLSEIYNIPIILINTDKYKSKEKTYIDSTGDNYINGYSASYIELDSYKRILK